MMTSGEQILHLVNLKKLDGFQYLFENFYPTLCRFSYRITGSRTESEDLVQNFFMKLWNSDVQFHSHKAMISYFYQSVKNSSLNVVRNQRKFSDFTEGAYEMLDRLESKERTMQQTMIEEETYRLVYAAINKLSPERKQVMMLSLEGHTNTEIAEISGISINTVKSLKLRSYRSLRKELQPAFCMFFM